MRIKSPINEGVVAEKLHSYIHQKVDSLDEYKWKGKTYAYKKLDFDNCPYVFRCIVRWKVDTTVKRPDVIDLTFALELAINRMLLPIWELTFQNIAGIDGIDSAFQKINEDLSSDIIDKLEF